MNDFRQTFRSVAKSATANLAVPAQLQTNSDKDILIIPKQIQSGFEAKFECTDVGFMPIAEGWHSGFWDVTALTTTDLKENLTEFIQSITTNAILEVAYSNSNPYKWTLHYDFEGNRVADTTGSIFFNWFGSKTIKKFSNGTTAT